MTLPDFSSSTEKPMAKHYRKVVNTSLYYALSDTLTPFNITSAFRFSGLLHTIFEEDVLRPLDEGDSNIHEILKQNTILSARVITDTTVINIIKQKQTTDHIQQASKSNEYTSSRESNISSDNPPTVTSSSSDAPSIPPSDDTKTNNFPPECNDSTSSMITSNLTNTIVNSSQIITSSMNNDVLFFNSPTKHVTIIYDDFDDFDDIQDSLELDLSYECIFYDNNI